MFGANFALTPNIRLRSFLESRFLLLPLRRPWTIRVDAALDLRKTLLMRVNHLHDGRYSTGDDRDNRHQQTAKTEDPIQNMIHSLTSEFGYDTKTWWS
jgi:hypothetical protein